MDLLLVFIVVKNISDLAAFHMFDSIGNSVQISHSNIIHHAPPSALLWLGAAANITLEGVGRVLPFHVGEAPIVTTRNALCAKPVGPDVGSSAYEQARRPLKVTNLA